MQFWVLPRKIFGWEMLLPFSWGYSQHILNSIDRVYFVWGWVFYLFFYFLLVFFFFFLALFVVFFTSDRPDEKFSERTKNQFFSEVFTFHISIICVFLLSWNVISFTNFLRNNEFENKSSILKRIRMTAARGVMVIIVGNGDDVISSNTERGWLHFSKY